MTDMVKKFNIAEEIVAGQTAMRGAKGNEALNVAVSFVNWGWISAIMVFK